jgi:hypothetical protein
MTISTQTIGSINVLEDLVQNAGANVAVSIAIDYTGYMANVVSTLKSILATDQQSSNTLSTISGTLTSISGTLSTMSGTLTTISNNLQTITTLASGDGIHQRGPDEFTGGASTMEVISVTSGPNAQTRTTYVTTRNVSESYDPNISVNF